MVETRAIKSSRVIITYTVFLFVLITILIALNFFFLEKNHPIHEKIEDIHNRKIDVVMSLTKVVRQRSLHMLTMYLSRDPWEQDEIFRKYHKLKLVFLDLRKEMQILGFAENERVLFDRINGIINKTEQIQNDIVERIQSGGDDKLHTDISERDLPLESKLLAEFDSLIEVIRNNMIRAQDKAEEHYHDTLYLISVAAILIFIVFIFLMRRSLHQINKIELGLISEAEIMSWDATHDALTNVYNRRWLQHKFEQLNDEQPNGITKHSLLYVDLDEFKPVNDNYGHVVGDSFLCGITRELEQCIRQNDTLARMGGDEFAILLENCDLQKARDIAECLVKRVKRFCMVAEDKNIVIAGCSVGIKEFITATASFNDLIKQTDSACYEAKKKGKSQSHLYSS